MNKSNITELGPFYHRGPGAVHHDITSKNLMRDEEYSVQVIVFAYLNSTVSTDASFGKVLYLVMNKPKAVITIITQIPALMTTKSIKLKLVQVRCYWNYS